MNPNIVKAEGKIEWNCNITAAAASILMMTATTTTTIITTITIIIMIYLCNAVNLDIY